MLEGGLTPRLGNTGLNVPKTPFTHAIYPWNGQKLHEVMCEWEQGAMFCWWRIWICDFTFNIILTLLVSLACWILNIFTLVPDKNSSSPSMFLKIVRNVFLCVHVHSALPHLLLLCLMVVSIHKCYITVICWTVPCPSYSSITVACVKRCKTTNGSECSSMCEYWISLAILYPIFYWGLCVKVDLIVPKIGKTNSTSTS